MTWTKSQQEAITLRGKNILVAAAAGSGKTAVLVQRIIEIIREEKVDVGELLVVTFTHAAAAEMKERIRKVLLSHLSESEGSSEEERNYLRTQLMRLPRASISTMHSFCIDIIRRYFHRIDVDPSFRIANESTVAILKDDSLKEIFEELYEEADPLFHELVDIYGGERDDGNLRALTGDIYRFIQSQPEPIRWLEEKAEALNLDEESFDQSAFAQAIRQAIRLSLGEAEEILEEALEICSREGGPLPYQEALLSDREIVRSLLQAEAISLSDFLEELAKVSHARLKTITKKTAEKEGLDEEKINAVKGKRDEVKAIIKDQKDGFGKETIASASAKLRRLHPLMRKMSEIIRRFDERYCEKKRAKGMMDFNDLEHFTLRILKEEEVRSDLRARYRYIFFDEYQDANIVQETILSAICREDNLFLVGDVKQSIYRFRLSDPTLFISRYERYRKGEDPRGVKIDLSSNFRSRKSLLDFANILFSRLMSRELGEVDYDEDAALVAAAEFPEEEGHVEIALIENSQGKDIAGELPEEAGLSVEEAEDIDRLTLEAMYTALRIEELIGGMYYDPKSGEHRKIGYQDVVILMRSLSSSAEVFARVFEKRGVPLYVEYSSSYFEVMEVRIFLDLLRIIDNPMQDEALLSVLHSPVFRFSAQELAEIRIAEREEEEGAKSFFSALCRYAREKEDTLSGRLRAFLETIEGYGLKRRLLKLEDFLRYLLEDTGYYRHMSLLPGGEERRRNLDALVEKALQYREMNSGGLFGFLRYVDKLLKGEAGASESKIFVQQAQVVRMMSIHKSKGLEFPVVFLCNTEKGFNKMDMRQDVMLHSGLGLGPKYVDTRLNTYSDSIAKKALKIKARQEMLSEEMRILYVALTRAVDRLILVGSVPDFAKAAENWLRPSSKFALMRKNSFLDWMMSVLIHSPDALELRLRAEKREDEAGDLSAGFDLHLVMKAELMSRFQGEEARPGDAEALFEEPEGGRDQEIERLLQERFSFVYPYLEDTVKSPKQSVSMRLREEAGLLEDELWEEAVELPRFMEGRKEFGSMEKGSILHFAMEVLDLRAITAPEGVEDRLQELVRREILTAEEAAVIDPASVFRFVESSVGRRMIRSENLRKEQEFLLQKDGQLISGIIDCCFEEEDGWVILDYKTDKVYQSPRETAERYRGQLDLYAEALEKSSGRKVKEKILYLFDIGQEISLSEKNG
ncbi:MAG: helicase-exonuclease AddAB subunit AddA [Peptostreptococcaceae bacterium]|nr:helicase-exonuclease AddAB subunit AddA [Peptostreptococcaceae bacterium]